MKTKLFRDHGHYFAEIDGGLYLLDTGSPTSIGNTEIALSGINHVLKESLFTLQDINGHSLFKCRASGLLGMDILSRHEVVIDCENECIYWDENMASNFSSTVPLKNVLGQAVAVPASIDDRECMAILDTGAWTSYVKGSYVAEKQHVGEIEDYNPIIGDIHAFTYPAKITVGGFSSNVEIAEMPQLLEMTLSMVGVDMVIGLDHIGASMFLLDISRGVLGVK